MSKFKHIYSLLAFFAFAAGFLVSFWPLSVLGLCIAGISGEYISALVIGLLLDVIYGLPVGQWHVLYVPFTLLAFVLCALHYYFSAFFREGNTGTL